MWIANRSKEKLYRNRQISQRSREGIYFVIGIILNCSIIYFRRTRWVRTVIGTFYWNKFVSLPEVFSQIVFWIVVKVSERFNRGAEDGMWSIKFREAAYYCLSDFYSIPQHTKCSSKFYNWYFNFNRVFLQTCYSMEFIYFSSRIQSIQLWEITEIKYLN